MTSNDLNQIGALMDKKLKTFGKAIDRNLSKITSQISSTEERLDKKLTATEERLDKKLTATEERLKEEMLVSDKRIMVDIGTFVEDTLFPMINEKLDEKADKTDIDRLERKLDRTLDTDFDHEHRIKDIESVPVIAHELKHRRSK